MSFAEAVAARAEVSVEDAEAMLGQYGIEVQPTGAAPVSLIVERVQFSGVKHREGRDDEPFSFDRTLSTGLWAVTSEVANLAGKSSVLFVIRWALTGRSHLTDDVQAWIDAVELEGAVGGERFAVRLTNSEDGIRGELVVANAPAIPFEGGSFEEVMDAFFLDRLRLEPMPFWQKRAGGEDDEGDRRRFGWVSYFPALHLRAENYSALLGDQVQGGHPGALMQVFLGLPWAQTVATARVARNGLKMERSAARRRHSEDEAAREATLAPLRAELEAARRGLDELLATRAPISPAEADARLAAFAAVVAREAEAQADLTGARRAVELAQLDLDEARKRLDALEQSRVVRPLLGRLTPSMCPRCRVPIPAERVAREEHDHACSVCAEELSENGEDESELDEARDAVAAAEEQFRLAQEELADAERRQNAASADRTEAAGAVREIEEQQPISNEARELETQIARLGGRLEQPAGLPPAEERDDLEAAYAVAEAALAEAEERRSGASDQLLDELGDEIATLARAFGIANLEAVRPSLGAQLKLWVGGAESSFSSRTPGERLRLRLATVIALLRVGHRLGVGRHPGLVLVDSPGAEEMVEGDLAAILGELAAVCEELPNLQLICATARAAEVREVLPEDRIIHGPEYAEVW